MAFLGIWRCEEEVCNESELGCFGLSVSAFKGWCCDPKSVYCMEGWALDDSWLGFSG